MAGIDRDLLIELDRHLRGANDASVPAASASPSPPSTHVDVSGVVEAVQLTAASMTAMAERMQELEAHSQAFQVSNRELEGQGAELAAELSDVAKQRDAFATDLELEMERFRRLESSVAKQVSRSTGLERELNVARTNLARIAEAVGSTLGRPA